MLSLIDLRNSFFQLYGTEPRLFSAPGRVNLIGEHTDYNEGFVLPLAANKRTFVAAAPRADRLIRVHSFKLDDCGKFDLDNAPQPTYKSWLRYVEGVARVLEDVGFTLNGADLAISSDVPIGAGLSSSAALEVSVGFALLKLAGYEVDLMKLALAAQSAEHQFVGTKSGLMDQLTAVFGIRNHALLIDCRTQAHTLIPLNLAAMVIVVCDTGVKHELATSSYNQRRNECEQALAILRARNPQTVSLRDVSVADLETHRQELPEPLYRRCRHVVSENDRTVSAAEALRSGNVDDLGRLMNLSHESLRDDYEVSCPELDIMVELARKQAGVVGARMMGGGFGGSTVNLVSQDTLEQFCSSVSKAYQRATNLTPEITAIEADDCVLEIN
ncbi:MAG TPA: galactokinase [Pyrinomonadaceae bacterium]|jgi:galactokinase|nr:galactokinase [Pyrinomonadaceae bacterium]